MHLANNDHINRSHVSGELNTGNRGKFSEAQTARRLEVHAKAIATKFPTIPDICRQWKEEFGIEISGDAEKNWRANNWKLIEKKKNELIEQGKIEVAVVGAKALSNTLLELAVDSAKTLKKMRANLEDQMGNLWNPQRQGHITDPKQRKAALAEFNALSDSLTKLSTSLTRQIDTLAEIAGSARARDREKADEDETESAKIKNEEFDPSAVEVSDEDRAALE